MVSLEVAQNEMVRRGKLAECLIAEQRPELINLFLTYQNEAIVARKFLENSLVELDIGAEILEVGGGILALAIQLASEGFKVTTVEPVGEGFNDIPFIMKIFSEIAIRENVTFQLIESSIEVCQFEHKFDFIFSINVMEHLKDPYLVLLQLIGSLKYDAKYRFLCPNYNFPYEPHFGKWLWQRRTKSFYLGPARANKISLESNGQKGLYDSINFITLGKLKSFSSKNDINLIANKFATSNFIDRALHDSDLKKRHKSLGIILIFLKLTRFKRIASLLSPNFQPIIDATAVSQNKTNSTSFE
jgi:2-polyprenyl-3-methyl-5-hydroxy-6-metoxy-1,4-benzoquinol methylase